MSSILDQYFRRKGLVRWRKALSNAASEPLVSLRQQRDDARKLRGYLNSLIHEADLRLTRPQTGSSSFPKPLGTDWSSRPDMWRCPLTTPGLANPARRAQLDSSVTLFHDCSVSEIAVRQVHNTRERDLAPFGMSVEVFDFNGSFLSFSIDLPPEASDRLNQQHLFRVATQIEVEHDVGVTARLNIENGPNTESVIRVLDLSVENSTVDFDLEHLPLNAGRVGKIWVDVILEKPRMNKIVIRDLTLCRHHRADL